MRYTSTRDPQLNVSFEEALTRGYAPDGGLFVPRGNLPQLNGTMLRSWQRLDYPELMQSVLRLFIDVPEVSDDELQDVCREALQGFQDPRRAVPLVALSGTNDDNNDDDETSSCWTIAELFHGPTYCFKDLGMRAVLRLLELFGRHRNQCITLLVSTTGDTGPAAAKAVADADQNSTSRQQEQYLKLAVHYPHEQISDFQRRQMTCLTSPNIQVVAFEGGGDDMDAPIKAFLQHQENNVVRTGVNSYNIGRPLTQMVIYIWSYLRMAETRQWDIPDDLSTVTDSKVLLDIVLPTGAMGNVTAAYMTKRMGLPLGRLYNAVNANDITDRVIRTGDFSKSSAAMVRTLSEAINVQVPYNFERILYYVTNGNADYVRSFYEQPEDARTVEPDVHAALMETFGSVRISDEEMKDALRHTYETHRYLCDPHTAVALAGVQKLKLLPSPRPLLVMATASACKFQAAVTAAVGPDVWNAYAALEPALNTELAEVPPLMYRKIPGATLEETQAHWQTLLKDVLQRLEAKKE